MHCLCSCTALTHFVDAFHTLSVRQVAKKQEERLAEWVAEEGRERQGIMTQEAEAWANLLSNEAYNRRKVKAIEDMEKEQQNSLRAMLRKWEAHEEHERSQLLMAQEEELNLLVQDFFYGRGSIINDFRKRLGDETESRCKFERRSAFCPPRLTHALSEPRKERLTSGTERTPFRHQWKGRASLGTGATTCPPLPFLGCLCCRPPPEAGPRLLRLSAAAAAVVPFCSGHLSMTPAMRDTQRPDPHPETMTWHKHTPSQFYGSLGGGGACRRA